MVQVSAAYERWEAEVHEGLVIFASLLDLVFQIRQERSVEHREMYLRTVLGTVDYCLFPDHPY